MYRSILVVSLLMAACGPTPLAQVIDRSPSQAPASGGGSRMGDEPLIIAADALEQNSEDGRHCVLAVTANAISGQFAGLVLRWLRLPDADLAMRMHIDSFEQFFKAHIEN